MAEGVGFEPTVPCETTVFKTVTIVHSVTPPGFALYLNTAKNSTTARLLLPHGIIPNGTSLVWGSSYRLNQT